MDYGFFSILPPFIAIVLALVTKDVFVALFTGCLSGYFILSDFNLITGLDRTLMSFIDVFKDTDNTIVIICVLLIGGLITVVEQSGGINGFVDVMVKKRGMIKNKRMAEFFTWIIGVLVFTSGTLSTLLTGAITRPLNDVMKVPHEKSSFIVHSTSTPVCVLIPLSAWGAFMIGLIKAQGIPNATQVLVKSIPLNFYAISAVLILPIIIFTRFQFKGMKKADSRADESGKLDADPNHAMAGDEDINAIPATPVINLLLPILTMIAVIIAGLLITGKGNLIEGDGMRSILWSSVLSLLVAYILFLDASSDTLLTDNF
jgi:Na+/H+ antiporter NhaC